jgi:hypothetical protein
MPSQLRSLLGTIRKKPTKASDGRSDEDASGMAATKKTAVSSDLRNLGLKNARFAVEAITTLASGDPIDDKEPLEPRDGQGRLALRPQCATVQAER